MSDKPRFARGHALLVARVYLEALRPATTRLIVAGSLRRMKQEVGDVEILYIPSFAMETDPADLFGATTAVHLADRALSELRQRGVIEPRLNKLGLPAWGPKNKLGRDVASGIPIDLFEATTENWFGYLVCRTGPLQSNIRVAAEAKRRGWHWNPYGTFTHAGSGETFVPRSEEDVFRHVGMDFHDPMERV